MVDLKSSDVIQQSKHCLDAEVDDETILMQVNTGAVYGLADVAKEIWVRISEPKTFGQLIDELVAEFDVERDECMRDVTDFLNDMLDKNFIEVTSRAPQTG